MFEKIKAKIEELKAEIESAVNADEVKADEAALGLLQGWVDGLTALKKVLEDKEKPAEAPAPAEAEKAPTATSPEEAMAEIDKDIAVEAPAPAEAVPSEPAQDAKGDASEPGSEAPAVQVDPPENAESQVK